ncbi:MAG: hypothetical protein V4508_08655 [Pseudomonadota bacterium]
MRLASALLLAMAALCGSAAAAIETVSGYRFQIVTGDDSLVSRRIAEDLYKRMAPVFTSFPIELAQKRRMVYVAIGPVALREVTSRKCDCVVIAAYTSSQVWQAVMGRLAPARAASVTAIYAEPAPADQLRLVALLYNRPLRIAAILGPDTGFLKPALRGVAEVEVFQPGDDINRALNNIAQTEVLLAVPDRAVYNTENIRNILLSTYRHNQAVIGFSADMVKAGALASTYSEIADINTQVAEVAAEFVASGELDPPQFPRYFSTIVNEGVARSLNVELDDTVRKFAHHPVVRRP